MTRERELRFSAQMSDAEALMWNVEKDPWLNPSGAMIVIFDQPLDMDLFVERMKVAVAKVPRLRERVQPGFGRLAPPMWATDPEFDIGYHLRHIALPGAGTERQLFDLCTRIYEDPFDRTRPLWNFTVIDGLEGGRGALFSKLHHSIADGIGAMRLSEIYIDLERDAAAPEPVDLDVVIAEAIAAEEADEDRPESPTENLLRSAGHAFRRQAGIVRRAAGEVAIWSADPLRARDRAEDVAGVAKTALDQMTPDEEHASGSPLWADRSRHRRLEVVSLPLKKVKKAGKAMGGSINDVFVTGAALGALRYHADRDTPVDGLNATFVVSTRTDNAIGGNSFTPVVLRIPGGIDDPKVLFDEMQERMTARRDEVAQGGETLASLAGVANWLPTSVVTQMARARSSSIDFATSNMRGAPITTYVAGAQAERMIVMGPVAGTAMNITTLSYDGTLEIGLFIDPVAVEDPSALRDCMDAAYADLFEAAGAGNG